MCEVGRRNSLFSLYFNPIFIFQMLTAYYRICGMGLFLMSLLLPDQQKSDGAADLLDAQHRYHVKHSVGTPYLLIIDDWKTVIYFAVLSVLAHDRPEVMSKKGYSKFSTQTEIATSCGETVMTRLITFLPKTLHLHFVTCFLK